MSILSMILKYTDHHAPPAPPRPAIVRRSLFKAAALALALAFGLTLGLGLGVQGAFAEPYSRFAGGAPANANNWNARDADFAGDGPHGLSVFDNLPQATYQLMANSRGGRTRVLQVAGGLFGVTLHGQRDGHNVDVILTYTADPAHAQGWQEPGNANHGLINATVDGIAVATKDEFNNLQVPGGGGMVSLPQYLANNCVEVFRSAVN